MEPSVADGMTPRCHIPRTELSWNVGSWRPATRRLMPARRARGHPDVRAAKATGPIRGEDQCPAIARQTGLLFGGRRVQRRPEVHGGGPRVVDAAAGGRPQIRPPQAPRGGWKEKKPSAVGAPRRTPVGGGRVAKLRMAPAAL